MTVRLSLVSAALFAATAVALGAFAAHGLKAVLTASQLATFQIGVNYQMLHALALLGIAILSLKIPHRGFSAAAILFIAGIFLFSGSLYALSFGAPRFLGPITPLGGICFIAGWICLLVGALRVKLPPLHS